MAFVRYVFPKKYDKEVKLTKTSIILSAEAVHKLNNSDIKFVGLHFDEATQRIGIEELEREDENAFPITEYRDKNSKIIKARVFFEEFGIVSEHMVDSALTRGEGEEKQIISFHINKNLPLAKPRRGRPPKSINTTESQN